MNFVDTGPIQPAFHPRETIVNKPFDPYRDWLQLSPEVLRAGRPNHYQLIGVDEFETDQQTITWAIDRAQAKVRSQRPGPHAAEWARLLDDLKEVRATLTDSARKQAYDDQLRGVATVPTVPAAQKTPTQAPAPEEVSAPEATSKFESMLKQSATSWPPGMAPPGVEGPQQERTPSASPSPEAAQPEETRPEDDSEPSDQPAMGDSPIPLSARWPAPHAGEGIPSSVSDQNSASPVGGPSPESAPVAKPTGESKQPSADVPMAVPLASIHPGASPYAMTSSSSDPMAPTAMPLGNMSSNPNADAEGSNIPVGSAVASQGATTTDPMAPLETGSNQAAIPMGTAVASEPEPGPSSEPDWSQSAEVDTPRQSAPNSSAKKKSNLTTYLALAVVVVMVIGGVALFGGFGDGDSEVVQNDPAEPGVPEEDILRPMTPSEINPRPVPVNPQTPVAPEPPAVEPVTPGSGTTDSEPPTDPPSENLPEAPVPSPPTPMPAEPEPPAEPMVEPAPVQPPPQPQPVQVTDVEIAELSKLLTTTKQALSDQNLAEAKESIGKALSLAKAPAHIAKAQRLDMLTQLVSEFWRAVNEQIGGLEGGDVITIKDVKVSIVEITPDTLIIRVAGMNRRYPRVGMSEGLAMGLANAWLDPNSEVTPLVRGAFMAVAKEGDANRAREHWREAANKGDVADLPEVLTDKYDVATLKAEASQAMPAEPVTANKPMGELTAADKTALANALRAAREALATGNVDDADSQLMIATRIADGSELADVVKRTQTLARHARVFWNAVAEGLGNLSPGTTLMIGNTEITITDVSRDQISYTVAGLNRSHARGELPGGLAMTIAFTVLDADDPASDLARGAYYAVATNRDPESAREAWGMADSPDTIELLKTLDDTYEW